MAYKFGTLEEEYHYGNIYEHEVHPNWSCVRIGVTNKCIPLLLDIAKQWEGPYGILYVLVASRLGHECCRYQSPNSCTYDDLELFAYTFQEYFEQDARHHIWFIDLKSGNRIIYDNHNQIYSYGNDEAVISLLRSKGFKDGDLRIPSPHQHRFNVEFDVQEDEIMDYFQWIKFPLVDQHDNP